VLNIRFHEKLITLTYFTNSYLAFYNISSSV